MDGRTATLSPGESTLHGITLALAVFTLGCFWWARRYFFRRSPGTPRNRLGLRLAGPVLGVTMIGLIASDYGRGSLLMRSIATTLFILSLILFWRTIRVNRAAKPCIAGTPGAPTHIITTGPYAIVRHPFYVSYMLYWLGCSVAAPGPISACIALAMLILYVRVAIIEESALLQSQVGVQYAEYARKTGMFVPRVPRL